MKFGLVYGNAASNHGDIAINRGAVRLLRQVAPDSSVSVAFIDPKDAYIDAARASVAVDDRADCVVHPWRSAGMAVEDELDAVAEAIHDPESFLGALGLQDCDAVFYNSGEHLFAPVGDENALDLLWRTAAALAVKNAGLPFLMLPSTFGPCDGPIGRELLGLICGLSDRLAGREPHSAEALRAFASDRVHQDWLLDPAFFMMGEADDLIDAAKSDRAEGGLGLVLRLEDYGLRAGKARSARTMSAHKRTSFRDSHAHAFAMGLAEAYRDNGGRRLDILVQTLADRDLSRAVAADIAERYPTLDVSAAQSSSLDEYMGRIARLDRLVAARFHACIFAMLCRVPAFGVHASVHGHKMPSMFSALGMGAQCAPLDAGGAPEFLSRVVAGPAADPYAVLEAKRRETLGWLSDASRLPPRRADLASATRIAAKALDKVAKRHANARIVAVSEERDGYRRQLDECREGQQASIDKMAALSREHAEARRYLEGKLDHATATSARLQRQLEASAEEQNKRESQSAKLVAGMRNDIAGLEAEVLALTRSRRFLLGSAIADALTGWKGLAGLPRGLKRALRAVQSEAPPVSAPDDGMPEASQGHRLASRNVLTGEQKRWVDLQLDAIFDREGDAVEFVREMGPDVRPVVRSFCLSRASAKAKERGLLEDAYRYGRAAREAFENSMSLTALAAAAHNTCRYAESLQLVQEIRAKHENLSVGAERMLQEAEGYASLAHEAARPRRAMAQAGNEGRSVYFLHSSLPHMSGGYALRSHGLIGGIRSAGYDIRPYTRPGFPGDLRAGDTTAYPSQDDVDGIAYRRASSEVARSSGEHRYMAACVEAFGKVLDDEKPEVVHARSTYLIAAPALIAAHRRGLPFVYEVSGLWELVHESRENAAANKARTERMRYFETLVMRAADRVITLTEAMREELVARGVDPSRISLAPNSVDPSKYLPRARDAALAAELGFPDAVPVIGYIGSFVDYEGLDDLIDAAGRLHRSGADFRLLLVGDGAEFGKIKQLVEAGGFRDKVTMTGRVAFDRVPAYYSLVDICPFPRKPWEVCEVVSPMKPFEPMAMEKAVVVSDTRALCDIVADGETGLRFEKGNVDSLTQALSRLIDDPGLRLALGKRAREWVIAHRSWQAMGGKVIQQYQAAIRDAGVAGN